VSIGWTESTDAFFNNYTLNYSASVNGPWYTIAVITKASQNYQPIVDISPGATWYWQVLEYDCFFGCSSSSSNILETVQPSVASLTYTTPSSTSVKLSWDNNAQYGGNLSFGSYQVMEAIGGGSYSSTATISSSATESYTVNGLSSGTGYSFYINTTDLVSSGGLSYDYWSASNPITFGTNVSLSAEASAHPTAADVGQKVSLSCAAAGGASPYTYAWTYGDGDSGSGATTSHAYSSSGGFTATCTVTDSDSSKAAGAVSISISPDPQVTASANHPSASPGYSISFTANATAGSGSFDSYSWSFGDGGSSSGSAANHAYARAGTFNASVTVTDSNGEQATGKVEISIANLTIAAGASKTVISPGGSVQFTATAGGGGGAPYTFSWSFGDGTAGTGSPVSHSYTSAGNFTPRVTVTDGLGSTNTTSLATVEVLSPLSAQIAVSTSNPSPGQAVTLNARVQGGSGKWTCEWNFGDSNVGSSCSVAHSWATSGTYNVSLMIVDSEAGNTTVYTKVVVASSSSSGTALGASIGGIPETWLLLIIVAIVVAAALVLLLSRGRGKSVPNRSSAASQICPKCGAPNSSGAAFCQKCGQPMPQK
jgi:PKD repeat protein